jgi:hypothetical protein
MSQENVDRFLEMADAFNRGDLDAASHWLGPEVVFEPLAAALEGNFAGPDGVRTFMAGLRDLFEGHRLSVEADHLDAIADRLAAQPLAEHLGGTAGKGGIGVNLDLELKANPLRHQVEQLLEQQRMLRRGFSCRVADQRRADLLGGLLMRPAIQGRPEREQRVMHEDQPIVGGQADVGLEPINRAGQRDRSDRAEAHTRER